MMIGVKMGIFGILVAALAGPAAAAPWPATTTVDPYGASAIAAGRYALAESKLAAAYARGDRSPEVLLNLAALRARDDGATARPLYEAVLAQPNADLLTDSGTAWSHDIAMNGLARTPR